jgi:hypothetical protein
LQGFARRPSLPKGGDLTDDEGGCSSIPPITALNVVVIAVASLEFKRVTATGVSGERPCAMSSRAMRGSVRAAIKITRVSTAVASRAQSTSGRALSAQCCGLPNRAARAA